MRIEFITLLFMSCFCGAVASAQDENSGSINVKVAIRQANQLLSDRFDQGTPGIAVSVLQDGKTIFTKCVGSSDIANSEPIRPDTRFSVASVSKQVTTLAALILESEGKISLTDRLVEHLPEMPEVYSDITLLQLAHHTSGIRSHKQLFGMQGLNPSDELTKEMVHQILCAQTKLNFEPGAEFSYSNAGYALLAEVIERRSGTSFPEYVRQKILTPLEMNDSFVVVDFRKPVDRQALAYNKINGRRFAVVPTNDSIVGSTGLFTSLNDMTKWVNNFRHSRVGNDRMFLAMERPGLLKKGKSTNYGLGQFVGDLQGEPMIYHAGADAGFVAFVARFPKKDFAVVLLGNCSSIPAQNLALQVAKQFLPEPESLVLSPPADIKSSPIRIQRSATQLQPFEGDYFDSRNFIQRQIKLRAGNLEYKRPEQGNRTSILRPLSPVEFAMEGAEEVVVQFRRNPAHRGDGQSKFMDVRVDGQVVETYERCSFQPSGVTMLRKLEGTYFSPELDTEYRIRLRDDQLQVMVPVIGAVELIQVRASGFRASNAPFNYLEFGDNEKSSSQFEISSSRAKGILFRKRSK